MTNQNHQDQHKIVSNNFEFTRTEEGWIWKALDVPLAKPSSKERPQIKAVEDIESSYQNLFEQTLVEITKSITKYLVKSDA